MSGAYRLPLPDQAGWEDRAACRGLDPALFFGPNGFESKRDRLEREAAAKAVCASCPALAQCRDTALREGEAFGVWGGLGEQDRRGLPAAQVG